VYIILTSEEQRGWDKKSLLPLDVSWGEYLFLETTVYMILTIEEQRSSDKKSSLPLVVSGSESLFLESSP